MSDLLNNYRKTKDAIIRTKDRLNVKQDIALLAVSKTKPSDMIRQLFHAGQRDFGENYLQEALEKQQDLADLDISWHFIGSIQRNKTRDIAQHFDWVHTVSRDVIAKRLSAQRAHDSSPLNVCIQVNIDDEDTKAGCSASEALTLAQQIASYDHLRLRGLMVIPSQSSSDAFQRTQRLFDDIRHELSSDDWDTLSMGMSGDYESAIASGSTIIRVGSAIFGQRVPH